MPEIRKNKEDKGWKPRTLIPNFQAASTLNLARELPTRRKGTVSAHFASKQGDHRTLLSFVSNHIKRES